MASATQVSVVGEHLESKSFKYMWSRYVQKLTMEYDLKAAKAAVQDSDVPIEIDGKENVAQFLDKAAEKTGRGFVPKEPGKLDIGIVGAGVAGLFTAMVFDWLNEHPELKGLEINYDIMEAAGEERLGGRLYTHKFSDGDPVKTHDYYDVGAMRFPNNDIMKRTFQLFNFIGLHKEKGGIIPYYLEDELGVCPSYFNDVRCIGNAWEECKVEGKDESKDKGKSKKDPFRINSGLPENGKIPEEFLSQDPAGLVAKALAPFIEDTKKGFDAALGEIKEKGTIEGKASTKLWERLMKADHMSTRQYLGSKENPENKDKQTFNYNTIEWLETATYGTGWYDQALSECVLEELDFGTPAQKKYKGIQWWWCIDGGAQRVAQLMKDKIKQPVQFNSQVEAINANVGKRGDPHKYVPMTLSVDRQGKKTEKDYFAVFNSTTLGALQRMDLKDAGLLWGTKQAIRSLGYGASCKVAIKFKTAWWQKDPYNIKRGGIGRTDLPLRVCVYPSYNIEPLLGKDFDADKPAVLLCSYTWGQDAQRIGSLISSNTPENEEQLIKVLLHDLALMHAPERKDYEDLLKKLKHQYMDHHAYDWYKDQNMSGAFAYFGPGQFSNMWQEIIKPNAFGQFYIVGEAASSHHAWIVGALESVIRAVYIMFEGLSRNDPKCELYKRAMKALSHVPKKGDPTYDPNDKPTDYEAGELPKGKPFYPLPEEMPDRQIGVDLGEKLTQDPKESLDEKKNLELTHSAALVALCLIESYVELFYGATPKE
ncbi:hypothetical protein CDV36_003861 [Fusarium kuroshium]|uniref:Amine oxidase domain-containing protein n=2 Tax=Fusarium solani species complex TaxID=232080 RepID=A0A3M2SFT4_9HYPO|nr:hypothetical protein CDV36_003861 [Fusarium kuroshium]RSL92352.1 hypothetical protein CEP52_013866 [Fusarium oligoseptatum]